MNGGARICTLCRQVGMSVNNSEMWCIFIRVFESAVYTVERTPNKNSSIVIDVIQYIPRTVYMHNLSIHFMYRCVALLLLYIFFHSLAIVDIVIFAFSVFSLRARRTFWSLFGSCCLHCVALFAWKRTLFFTQLVPSSLIHSRATCAKDSIVYIICVVYVSDSDYSVVWLCCHSTGKHNPNPMWCWFSVDSFSYFLPLPLHFLFISLPFFCYKFSLSLLKLPFSVSFALLHP